MSRVYGLNPANSPYFKLIPPSFALAVVAIARRGRPAECVVACSLSARQPHLRLGRFLAQRIVTFSALAIRAPLLRHRHRLARRRSPAAHRLIRSGQPATPSRRSSSMIQPCTVTAWSRLNVRAVRTPLNQKPPSHCRRRNPAGSPSRCRPAPGSCCPRRSRPGCRLLANGSVRRSAAAVSSASRMVRPLIGLEADRHALAVKRPGLRGPGCKLELPSAVERPLRTLARRTALPCPARCWSQ